VAPALKNVFSYAVADTKDLNLIFHSHTKWRENFFYFDDA
jgi:hypothetical protein